MKPVINFNTAAVEAVSLAQVGNATRGESLKMSKELCSFEATDSTILTYAFLKPFKNLERYHFYHHFSIQTNELYSHVGNVFDDASCFLDKARKISRFLYETTKHPNIKSGDLCIAFLKGIQVNGETCEAVSIVKSESKVSFLEVASTDSDLQLITHNGIYPDKVDKGVLIINYDKDGGFLVYTFDKADTNFWVKDFLGVRRRKDNEYKTKEYAKMCRSFVAELSDQVKAEQRHKILNGMDEYLATNDSIDADNFKEETLQDPILSKAFEEYIDKYQDDEGDFVDINFEIDHQSAKKIISKAHSLIKLDSGVKISFEKHFDHSTKSIERGVDEVTGLKFVKFYYQEEV